MRRRVTGAATVGALVVGLTGAALLPPGTAPLAARPAAAAGLLPYDSCEPLLEAFRAHLLRTATAYGWNEGYVGDGREGFMAAGAGAGRRAAAPVPAAEDSAVGSGPTGTNVQEQGVDEPDIAKLADGRIVTVAQGALQIVTAGPDPVLLGTLPLATGSDADPGFGEAYQWHPEPELLLDDQRALVITQGYVVPRLPSGEPAPGLRAPGVAASPVRTTLRLADLADPEAPRWLEDWTIEGTYVSARLVDGMVRLVTRSTPTPVAAWPAEPYGTVEEQAAVAANRRSAQAFTVAELLPIAIHRSGGRVLTAGPALDCQDVSAAPGAAGGGLLTVTALRPADGLEPVDALAVQADGDLVYAAADRLFVATSRWGTAAASDGLRRIAQLPDDAPSTQLHSFDTSADAVRYLGTGTVPGYVLGRWALSWHEDALRVATTEGEPWGAEPSSSSTVTVLREAGGSLVPAGRVTGLGLGERIQAVRYLGDLATVVTFRQTDPLYVLDLADPERPSLLGELKVPGFSTYLHPVGDNRLLGIGMEAEESTGRTTGMQASLFDLSDPATPVQRSRLPLGQGYTEAMFDSRAFGYDPDRRLAMLPLSDEVGMSFALGISVGAEGTLREAGRMPLTADEQARRILADGEHVYAASDRGVVAGRASDLQRTGALVFPNVADHE